MSKEELDTYLNSWREGDNITITADCLNMLEAASKDLEILELISKCIVGTSMSFEIIGTPEEEHKIENRLKENDKIK